MAELTIVLGGYETPSGADNVGSDRVDRAGGDAERAARRVLVVDDDPTVRNLVRRVLVAHGYIVQEASDGVAALREIERDPPDLILLDLLMPRLDGWGAIAQLRARGSNVPVLVFSVIDTHAGLQGVPFLPKPFRPDQLLAAIDATLADPLAD